MQDPSATMPVEQAVRLLLRGGSVYKQHGAPHARFVHIDRLPCLVPLIAGGLVATVAGAIAQWDVAGGALLGGGLLSALLWWAAPAPHVQAVLGDRLVLRRWWLAPRVFRASEVKRMFQIHALGRDGRFRRSLFEVEALPEGAEKLIKHRFMIASAPVAERLRAELEAAGFAPATSDERRG